MNYSRRSLLFPTVFIMVTTYVYWEYAKYLITIIILITAVTLIFKLVHAARRVTRGLQLHDIETMDGIEFEYFIAQVLHHNGYTNVVLTERYDYGVDIIADKDGVRWGVQVKRYSGLVKADAVRQVITGLAIYGCDRAMVITNSNYSTVARRLADSNDCVLIDKTDLQELVS